MNASRVPISNLTEIFHLIFKVKKFLEREIEVLKLAECEIITLQFNEPFYDMDQVSANFSIAIVFENNIPCDILTPLGILPLNVYIGSYKNENTYLDAVEKMNQNIRVEFGGRKIYGDEDNFIYGLGNVGTTTLGKTVFLKKGEYVSTNIARTLFNSISNSSNNDKHKKIEKNSSENMSSSYNKYDKVFDVLDGVAFVSDFCN